MKRFLTLLAILGLGLTGRAQTATNVFQQTVNTNIPAGNPTGLLPTTVVSGLSGTIQDLTVTLDITNGFNGDLYAYLSFQSGYAVLLNSIGKDTSNPYGSGSSGMQLILNDNAATDVHLASVPDGDMLVGTWQPDGRETNPQFVLPTDARTAMLGSFNNLNPNGTWTLFIADMATGYQSTLVNWQLTITTVPEPGLTEFLAPVGLALAFMRYRSRRSVPGN